jgi:hypothetical protein
MSRARGSKRLALFVTLLVVCGVGGTVFLLPRLLKSEYTKIKPLPVLGQVVPMPTAPPSAPVPPPKPVVTHVETPESVRAIYMTSWVAGTTKWRADLASLIDTTELNSLVIDIKDYTGAISFKVEDPYLVGIGSYENRIPDVREFIAELHKKNIYVIGRISVFQDPLLVKKRPDLAVRTASDKNVAWKDYKGISWLDAGSKEVWDYVVALAREAHANGFDEINFDYIRFPSDGNMRDIYYPMSEGKVKREVMREFFAYVNDQLHESGMKTSADFFGMTTTNTDDLNIGQVLEDALPNFDYVSPMVYPSHYPPTFMGLLKPAEEPYAVVKYSMDHAVARAKAASTSPLKLRPWLQDFNLGATYDAAKVRAQMQATYDAGLNSWMLWSAANRYTVGALKVEN